MERKMLARSEICGETAGMQSCDSMVIDSQLQGRAQALAGALSTQPPRTKISSKEQRDFIEK